MTEGSNPVGKISPVVEPTEYSVWPADPTENPHNMAHWRLRVQYWPSTNKQPYWTVEHLGLYLNKDGEWVFVRSEAAHYFSSPEALSHATEALPKLTINGRTYLEWQEYFKEKGLK